MRERADSTDCLILDIPGYACDTAVISIPRPLLEAIGLDENLPILLRLGGEGAGQITVVGQAEDDSPGDRDLIVAKPDLPHGADYPPTFVFESPTWWMEGRRINPRTVTDGRGGGSFQGVHEGFDLERCRQFLQPDRSLVIPT